MSVNGLFVSICPLRHKANGLKSSYRLVNVLPGWCMGDYVSAGNKLCQANASIASGVLRSFIIWTAINE